MLRKRESQRTQAHRRMWYFCTLCGISVAIERDQNYMLDSDINIVAENVLEIWPLNGHGIRFPSLHHFFSTHPSF